MALKTTHFLGDALELFTAAQDAIAQIPPAFPLAATVAVNPYLGQMGLDRATTAALLEKTAGVRITPPRASFEALPTAALESAAAKAGLSLADLRAALSRPALAPAPLPTVADLAHRHSGVDWPEFIADRFGLWAAARYDEGQALWPAPRGEAYQSWRAFAASDLTPELAGLGGFAARAGDLPPDARSALVDACTALGITATAAPLYFQRLLRTQQGWAQFARGKGWLAERDGGRDKTTFHFLAIALQWEAALLDNHRAALAEAWEQAIAAYEQPVTPTLDHTIDAALTEAADRVAEEALALTLSAPAAPVTEKRPAVQAAFCIDVRSEVFRRALESVDPGIETIGFAGFFGLAVSHRCAASDVDEARAPVLLKPGLSTHSTLPAPLDTAQRIALRGTRAWGRFKQAAVSAFAFVEAAGPAFAPKLIAASLPRAQAWPTPAAPVMHAPLADRIAAGRAILGAMSMAHRPMARLVVIAGHGAQVTNAPHASALQCGACGGHAGDVNARLLAGLLNDAQVRAGLAEGGLNIPADTAFIGAVHDTVADTLTLFDTGVHPAHAAEIAAFRAQANQAGLIARTERAQTLPRGAANRLAKRGGDWAELRPEWGLAGCEGFIAAPRTQTRGRDLGGRVFLHDYDWQADEGFKVLELILTAPVVVASWINLQYHGSTLAPQAFGGGNKLVHNVTGGIGVVEGNGGNLLAGLPWQSVHDGDVARHPSRRLKVVLAAPASAIDAILSRHAAVKALFDNGWLSLHRMDDAGRIVARYDKGVWDTAAIGHKRAA